MERLNKIFIIKNICPVLGSELMVGSWECEAFKVFVNVYGLNMHFVSPHNRICKLSYCN